VSWTNGEEEKYFYLIETKKKNPPKQEYSKTQKVTRGGNFKSKRRDGSVRTNCFHFYDVAPDFVFFFSILDTR
jgi:hypothetical protein